jgi:hypothetical protein
MAWSEPVLDRHGASKGTSGGTAEHEMASDGKALDGTAWALDARRTVLASFATAWHRKASAWHDVAASDRTALASDDRRHLHGMMWRHLHGIRCIHRHRMGSHGTGKIRRNWHGSMGRHGRILRQEPKGTVQLYVHLLSPPL